MSRQVQRGTSLFIRGTNVLPPTGEQSLGINLFLGSENTTHIIHRTNWDLSTSSTKNIAEFNQSKINIEYSEKFDNFNAIQTYELESNWYYNDIDIKDDIAIVATKDWTSTEKFSNRLNVDPHYFLTTYHSWLDGQIVPATKWYFYADAVTPIGFTPPTVTIDDMGTFPIDPSFTTYYCLGPNDSLPSFTIDDPNTYVSPGYGWYESSFPCELKQCSENYTPVTLPPIICCNHNENNDSYFCESSSIGLPLPISIGDFETVFGFEYYDTVNLNNMDLNIEYFPDLSGVINNTLYGNIGLGNNVINYTFGGIKSFTDLSNDILYREKYITGDLYDFDDFKYYIVEKKIYESCSIYQVNYYIFLSSYIKNNNPESISPIGISYLELRFGGCYSSAAIKGFKYKVGIDKVEITKYVNHFSCGKVDLYHHNVGDVESINGNIITSTKHNLTNGEKIKITSALSDSITDVNGIKYVSGVDSNSFSIFYDSNLTSIVSLDTVDSTRISGIKWTSDNWKYKGTLYSPMGKNGYGYDPKVRLVQETGIIEGSVAGRAVPTSNYDGEYILPHSYCIQDYNASLYPFEKLKSINDQIDDSLYFNGNRFGADVQIERYNDGYILMVTEPGAEASFSITDETNKYSIIPNHLPYGRIHFYNISGNLDSDNSISYIGTVSNSGTHPWKDYESANINYRKTSSDPKYYNYPLDINFINTYNFTNNNYWQGARFYSWLKDYILNPVIRFELPDQNAYPYEFGWVDYFGKSAVFNIDNDILYGIASTQSKYAEWNIASGLQNVACQSLPFSINLNTNAIINPVYNSTTKQYSGIVNQLTYISQNKDVHFSEIESYGKNIDYNNNELYIGWNGTFRPSESIYIYNSSGNNYSLKQEISSAGSNNFGEYLILEDDIFAANKYSKLDDSGNVTSNRLNYIYIYKKDKITDKYYLLQRISPTIDIGKFENYDLMKSNEYEMTYNYAYDNSTGNSATQLIDLYGRYDLYGNSLIIKDLNGYAYFAYNNNDKRYKLINYDTSINSVTDGVETSIVRLRPENGSFFGDYTGGEFIDQLIMFDGAERMLNVTYNTLTLKNYVNPSFLPLFVKTIEGVSSGSLDTFIHGKVLYNTSGEYPSGLTLYTQAPLVNSGSLDLFCKQVDVVATGLNLRLQVYDISNTSLDLRISSHVSDTGTIPLFVGTEFYKTFPMYMKTYAYTTIDPETGETIQIDADGLGTLSETFSLYIQNSYTGVPNSSGQFNMYIQTDEYADYGKALNLAIGKNLDSTSSTIPLYLSNINQSTDSDSSVSGINLYTVGKGIPVDDSFNLFIKTPQIESLPLTLFNVYNTSEIDLFIRNADIYSSGIDLYTSGELYPTTTGNTLNLRIRGTSF